MKIIIIGGVLLALFTGVVYLSMNQSVGGGLNTILQLDQFTSTSTPFDAITTNEDGKDLYIPYSNATTSNLGVISLNAANCDIKATINGDFYCGTDATGAGGGDYAWTPLTTYSETASATTSPIWLQDTLYASSTAFFSDLVTFTANNSILLPQVNDAATPTLAFGDGDTGFYESGDDTVVFSSNGVNKWIFSGILKSNSTGVYLRQNASLLTEPSYSFNSDTDTGMISVAADQLSLIAGGVEWLRLDNVGGQAFFPTGNLGIGTTSPYAKLSVVGETVSEYFTATSTNASTFPSANITKLSNLTTNGFVKTGSGDGTLSIDTSTYLTGNQTITLSGDVSGSGATSITTTIGALKVLGSMIANATIDLTTKVTGLLPSANIVDEYLFNTGDVGTGVFDFGGATSLEIPNGAAPVTDTLGEISLDTTDDQIIVFGASEKVIRTTERIFGFTLASTSPEWFNGGSLPVPPETDGYTVTSYSCYVTAGTSVVLTPTDGTNAMDAITCATTITSDTSISANATVTAGELMSMSVGAITGTVDYVSFSAYGTWGRE